MIIPIFVFMISTFIFFKYRDKPKRISLKNKLALVSGGANGLGQKICMELAKEGCKIAFCDIASPDETLRLLQGYNVEVKAYKTDVTKFEEIEKLRDDTFNDFGCDIDILINNAALIPHLEFFEQTHKDIEAINAVNINSVILMSKCFLDRMKEKSREGHIVSISSMAGLYASPHLVCYTASKHAVTGFMLALKEFLRLNKLVNIHTTVIHPYVIATKKEIIEAVNPEVVDLLDPTGVAKIIVSAIAYRKSFVSIPRYLGFWASIFNTLPFKLQEYIRDLRNEKNFVKE